MNRKIKQAIVSLGPAAAVMLLCSRGPFIFSEMDQNAPASIEIEKEWEGYHSGSLSPTRMVISTPAQWKEIWEKIQSREFPIPDAPEIDFNKNMVLAVFMGEQKSGGYEIRITKIIKTEDNILVEVLEKKPSPDSFSAMALTSPYHAVLIKKYSLPVKFQDD